MSTSRPETKVYDYNSHIKELIKEICTSHKKDGYENFETISMFLREKFTKLDNGFQYKNLIPEIKKTFKLTSIEEEVLTNFSSKNDKTIKTIPNFMEDIISQSKLLEWGGVSFSDEEWYKIRMSMKKILIENNCEYLRFFGKIYGIKSDYYILQGLMKDYPRKIPNPYIESRGNEGINRYTFWVSNSILEAWYELPDITPEQIISSRNFKYHFTGDLNAKVKSFVAFPGREMHLLKCQIIRILHSCGIAPKGYLKRNENFLEGKAVDYDEEYKPGAFEDMRNPEGESWVHEHGYIFPNGKVIDLANENQVDRLREISQDEKNKVKEGEGENAEEKEYSFWKIKVVGDTITHNRADKDPVIHACIVIKNLRWPGTLTVWKEGNFASVYVGFGIKATGSSYFPTQIKKMEKDLPDVEEQKEPNPEKEPVKEEEKKEEGEEGGEEADE